MLLYRLTNVEKHKQRSMKDPKKQGETEILEENITHF